MKRIKDIIFKIIICGEGGVGKTSLTKRYVTGSFNEHLKVTIGVNFHRKDIEVKDKLITLQIWDFAGESRFRFLLPEYVKGASGVIFMYDITRYSTLKNIDNWIKVFKQGLNKRNDDISALIIGGKADLSFKRTISIETAIAFARKRNFIETIECSSKTGENVEKIFNILAFKMMENTSIIYNKSAL